MDKDKISMRQMLVLLFAALLSPAVRVLPARTGTAAGRAGWLSALAALPVLLALCWGIFLLFRKSESGDGMSRVYQRVLGRGLGRLVTWLYLAWGMVLLGCNLRLFGLRFLSTSYRNAPMPLFITALLLLALWLTWKRLGTLARAGQVFYLALAIGLGAVLLLGTTRVELSHVLPLWTEDLPAVVRSAAPVLSVLGYTIYGAFLGGSITRGEEDRAQTMKWGAAFCLVLTALQWICLGSFGPELTRRMEAPFFMMVKGVGVEGAFERVESVIIALWVLSDLALIALLLSACSRMAGDMLSLRQENYAAPVLAAGALAGALWAVPDTFALYTWMERVVLPGNLLFGFLLPGAALLSGWMRKLL